jgi:hypothetical protein
MDQIKLILSQIFQKAFDIFFVIEALSLFMSEP